MISSSNQPDLLRLGIAQAQSGNKVGARQFFEKLAAEQPNHETVWLWLSSVAPDATTSARYLERALEVDPGNQQARQWLERLCPSTANRLAPLKCPLCSQVFTAKPKHCARCGAELDLTRPEVFFTTEEPEVDRELIEKAIERATEGRGMTPAQRHRILALGYLNLRQYQKALSQLSAFAALSTDDADLTKAVQTLTEHLEKAPPPSPSKLNEPQESEVKTAEIDPQEILREIAATSPQRPTVLVVDDSPTVRHLVSDALKQNGYRTLLAQNGMEALARIQEAVPDLVLLDVTMPHLDGFKICRVIKDSDLTAHVPVVFLSSKDGFLDKVRGRMAGAVDYLPKPVSKDVLLKVVGRHCSCWTDEKA